uniref:Uncharacterized protein n=1 Tax=Physcomitrium patens TaxID=3218 RepID=A0A2K1IQ98_PHYPA|nr:hypothetical protein PHYPA_025580 [Physcomitrium patens]
MEQMEIQSPSKTCREIWNKRLVQHFSTTRQLTVLCNPNAKLHSPVLRLYYKTCTQHNESFIVLFHNLNHYFRSQKW